MCNKTALAITGENYKKSTHIIGRAVAIFGTCFYKTSL
jgi:hypothetical protein